MNPNMAQIDLMVMQTEVKDKKWLDAVVEFTNKGVPPEVVMRLQELWEVTKTIGNQVYEVGKILVMKIIEFIMANPGMAIGVVLGVAVGSLTNMIPWIGTIMAPIAMAIGGFFGAVAGHRLDKLAKGEIKSYKDSSLFADLITTAKEFWRGLVEIFMALKEHFVD
jgi:hypothetical protein